MRKKLILSLGLAGLAFGNGGIAPLNQQLQRDSLPAVDLRKAAPAQREDEGEGDEP